LCRKKAIEGIDTGLAGSENYLMTIFFVSRHPGALDWMRRHGIAFDRHAPHLAIEKVRAGDTVIGSLPVNLAAEVCARGATYRHLSLEVTAADRGRELSADELDGLDATLATYEIRSREESSP
jgi:CRISPR-associated protein Csx16